MAAISPDIQQAVQQAVATGAQKWQEAAAQMHQEIGTLGTQVQDVAQAVPQPQEVPPAWWMRDCLESQSPSTAAQAGRIGALSSEAMRVLALRRWAYSWNERRDQLDRCSTRR